LLNTLERVPLKSADAFVAFTGLDLRPKDSGQCRGRRRLSKRGPGELRRLLYLAAMAAAKTKDWKAFYQHQRDKGYHVLKPWLSWPDVSRARLGRTLFIKLSSIQNVSQWG
jgi:hypothetical protein